jgi:uncharacterized membrane protein YbhN (UPF0104 family)
MAVQGSSVVAEPADAAEQIKKVAALVLAIVLVVVYLVLVGFAWGKTGEEAESWARRIVLLGGIEALAFAAAGWLWGKEVSRQTIEQANARANEANDGRSEAEAQATTAKADAVAAAQALRMLGPALEQSQSLAGNAAAQPRQLATAILERYGVAG